MFCFVLTLYKKQKGRENVNAIKNFSLFNFWILFWSLLPKGGKTKMDILKQISEAQNDHEKIEEIIKRFNPLLKKYARKLNYEDAYFDMRISFIELILNIKVEMFPQNEDKYILGYISKATHQIFLKYARKNQMIGCEIIESQIEDFDLENLGNQLSYNESYDGLLIEDLKKVLSEKEYEVICEWLFQGKSIQQIANQEKISRQAVFAKKRRALKKMKNYFAK